VQRWHRLHEQGASLVDELMRKADEATRHMRDLEWEWVPHDSAGVAGVAERPGGGIWAGSAMMGPRW
jgi:hypothetical protein